MTPHEIEIATALGQCSMLPGTSQKRFCRDMAYLAQHSPERPLSDAQARYLLIMAHRYRRQIPARLVPAEKPE